MWDAIVQFWDTYGGIVTGVIAAVLIALAFWVISLVLRKKVFPALEKWTAEKKHTISTELIQGFARPLSLLLKILGIGVGLLALCHWLRDEPLPPSVSSFFYTLPAGIITLLRVIIVITVAWGLVASSDIAFLILRKARRKLDLHMSRSLARFLAAVFNVLVVAIAVIIILEEFNFDIKALIAGLGIGGLTIALAAKDSAANFFGGLIIVTEKPFEIGDQVTASGVDGVVEDISLRSTKIRTQPGSLTIVPNANISGANITNWSGSMEKRRAEFDIGLTYDATAKQMRQYTAAVRTMLETDPEIVPDSVVVRFASLGDSSLNIHVIFYTSLPGVPDHLRIKERVNYALMELAEECGVAFAFPTQTIFVQPEDGTADGMAAQADAATTPAGQTKQRKMQPVKVLHDGGAPPLEKKKTEQARGAKEDAAAKADEKNKK